MADVTVVTGNAPIPFSGLRDGKVVSLALRRPLSGVVAPELDQAMHFGDPGDPVFGPGPGMPSAPLRAHFGDIDASILDIANTALARYEVAVEQAESLCSSRSSVTQRVFDWATGSTATLSICDASAQMRLNHDSYAAMIADPSTTTAQAQEILLFINKEINVSDLVSLANATNAVSVVGTSVLKAPGTAVGMAGNAAASGLGTILGAFPWWAWAIGGIALASWLGWKPLEALGVDRRSRAT